MIFVVWTREKNVQIRTILWWLDHTHSKCTNILMKTFLVSSDWTELDQWINAINENRPP